MKSTIYCLNTSKGVLNFYLQQDNETYFLFQQNYRKSVQSYFGQGVLLNDAMNFYKTHKDAALIHTMEKLPTYIKYIEKEYQINVYNKSKQKQSRDNKKARRREDVFDIRQYMVPLAV